jgi:sugar phosphate permease
MGQDLNVTRERFGYFGSMYFWPYAISQPFIGLLVDLVEPAYVISLALFFTAGGSVIIALARSFLVCCGGRAVVGLGAGAVMVPVCKVFANWFNPRYFFIFQGLVLCSGAAGGVLAQGPLAAVITTFNWRSTFYGIAIVGAFVSLLTLLFRGTPTKMGFSTPRGVTAPLLRTYLGCPPPTIADHFRTLWRNMKKVLSNPHFWTLALWDGMIPGVYYNLSSMWGAMYLQDIFGFSDQTSADLMIYLNVAWILGTPLLTFVSEFAHTRKWVIVVTSSCMVLVSGGFLIINGKGKGDDAIVQVLLFAFGFFGSAPASVAVAMFKEMESKETSGTALGCSNFFPFITSALFQELTAYVLELVDGECPTCHSINGFRLALWVPTGVAVILGLLGALFSRETFPIESIMDSTTKEISTQDYCDDATIQSITSVDNWG